MKRLLIPGIGAALLAALATPPAAHAAQGSTKSYEDITRAAAGLRQLAAKTCTPEKEMASECTKQTTWLKNAAGRCDALAKKMQAAGSKSANVGKVIEKGAATEWPNLRGALQKENGEFSFGSQQAKARQQEATQLLESLGH